MACPDQPLETDTQGLPPALQAGSNARCRRRFARVAFTLIELLVVMATIVVVWVITVPAVSGIKTARDVTKALHDIQGIIEQGRAYAMSNGADVYIGIGEYDASIPSGTNYSESGGGTRGRGDGDFQRLDVWLSH